MRAVSTGEFVPRPDIIYRTLLLIRAVTDDRRRLKQLEEETGIPDRQWKHVWALKQRPTAHMLEALARRWPEYAFWLVSGLTDVAHGHVSPSSVDADQPERDPEIGRERDAAREYFEAELLLQEAGPGSQKIAAVEGMKDQPIDDLGDLLQGVTGDLPADEDEELWVRYLALLNKQEEAKDLDRAIAQIAKEKRVRALAERCDVDLSSPGVLLDIYMAYARANGKRKAKLIEETRTRLVKNRKPR